MSEHGPLTALIRREIEAQGAILFARFMELALYAPGLGYYEREEPAIGRQGDFYTSVSVGSLFGELLAFRFAEELPKRGTPLQLVEAGAHDGRLAADILGWLHERRPADFAALEYWIVEPSPRRRAWQEKTLAKFATRVRWSETLGEIPVTGYRMLFCNELLDAFPVHRFGWDAREKRWFEWSVGWDDGRFVWRRMENLDSLALLNLSCDSLRPSRLCGSSIGSPTAEARRAQRAEEEAPSAASAGLVSALRFPLSAFEDVLPDGYTLEVSPAAEEWWRQAAATLGHGQLLCLDYGLTDDELFAPQRTQGTLRAYRQHRHATDPLADPGEQDLTAHVNFSALQRAGEREGLTTETLVSQTQFLTRIAARTWAKPESFGAWTPPRTRQFQTLTHPEHLGRAFRVLIQSRD